MISCQNGHAIPLSLPDQGLPREGLGGNPDDCIEKSKEIASNRKKKA
jgi:hypothetical protein